MKVVKILGDLMQRGVWRMIEFCKEQYMKVIALFCVSKVICYFYSFVLKDWNLINCILGSTKKKNTNEATFFRKLKIRFQNLKDNNNCVLENVLQRAREKKFDFSGLWSRKNPSAVPVLRALHSREVDRLTILLRYGFSPGTSFSKTQRVLYLPEEFPNRFRDNILPETLSIDLLFCPLASLICSVLPEAEEMPGIWDEFSESEEELSEDEEDLLENQGELPENQEVFPENHEVFPDHQGALHGSIEDLKAIRQSFTLMWRASTDTLWTLDDLECLHLSCKDGELLLEEFPDLFARAKTPRTLKHISRCRVRKSLHDAWNLPNGIKELIIPKELREYLDLRE